MKEYHFTHKQANWDETDPNDPAYIKNKPDISGNSSTGGTSSNTGASVICDITKGGHTLSEIAAALQQATEDNTVATFKEYTGLSDADWDALIRGKVVALRCKVRIAKSEDNNIGYLVLPLDAHAYNTAYVNAITGDNGVQVIVQFYTEVGNVRITYEESFSTTDTSNYTGVELNFPNDLVDAVPDR